MAVFLPLCSNYNLGYEENQLVNLLYDQNDTYIKINEIDRDLIKLYIFTYIFFVGLATTILWFIC